MTIQNNLLIFGTNNFNNSLSEIKDYLLDHSSIMYVLSADGKYLTHFGPGATSAQIAAFFNREIH